MRGLLIYSVFGSSLKGETAFSMRRAKNCSTLDVMLRLISEAFLGSSAWSCRNRWLRSSMAQSKTVFGFFLQQISPPTAEKWGTMELFLSCFVPYGISSLIVFLAPILICSLFFQFSTQKSCCTSETHQNKWQMDFRTFCFLSPGCLRVPLYYHKTTLKRHFRAWPPQLKICKFFSNEVY